jgi:hypothetical protein
MSIAMPWPMCEWCCDPIYHDDDCKHWPDDLPDHIPVPDKSDDMTYHRWCFEDVVHEATQEIALKHGAD